MDKEISVPLISSGGTSVRELINDYGREAVMDNLYELVYDTADIVFVAAWDLRDRDLTKVAAEKLVEEGRYLEHKELKHRAAAYLNELSMQ